MKKKILLLLLPIFCLVGCGGSTTAEEKGSSGSSTSEETKQPQMEKHEVILNLKNYANYFDIDVKVIANSMAPIVTQYSFSGCLTYAYYDNAEFTITYGNSSSEATLKLNAAGNGTIKVDGRDNNSITAVSGKVIYWL